MKAQRNIGPPFQPPSAPGNRPVADHWQPRAPGSRKQSIPRRWSCPKYQGRPAISPAERGEPCRDASA